MKKKCILFSFSLRKISALILLLCCLNIQAQTWGAPQPIEKFQVTGSYVGQYSSLMVVNGNPAVSYYDASSSSLVYIRANNASGTSWPAPILIDTSGYTGLYTSLEVVNGNPAISYFDFTTLDLKYIRALDPSGLTWGLPVTVDVIGDVGEFTSLVIVNGNPAISYYDSSNQDLKYVRANDASGTSWGSPVAVDVTGNVGLYASMQVVNGHPAISYNEPGVAVKYVRASDPNGSGWNAPVVVATVSTGLSSCLQVVNGNPAISFCDGSNQNHMMYVRANDASGIAWGTPLIIDPSITGMYSSLQIVNGNPAISYYDQVNMDLKYARANDASGTSWASPFTLDGYFVNAGMYTSMQIVNGNPAVSYLESYSGDLKYIQASNASGTAWGAPQGIDIYVGSIGQFPSACYVNGIPSAVYSDGPNYSLKYIQATNLSGTGWGTSYSFQATSYYGQSVSLQDLNGNPAVCFQFYSGSLMFKRGLNPVGSAWNSPVTVDPSGGSHQSLQIVGGIPAISYCSPNYDLNYIRASDPFGNSWPAPISVSSTGSVGLYTSMQMVNGNPAISYYDLTNKNLKYVRALDNTGSTWGAPISVDLNVNVNEGLFTSLQVVNGYPAIAYFDITNKDLKYVRSTDVFGAAWGTPLSVDVTGDVGRNPSLNIVNGNPAITYYDFTNKNLKYIRAYDTAGLNWAPPMSLDTLGLTGEYPTLLPVGSGAGIVYHNSTTGRPYFITGSGCYNTAGHSTNGALATAFQSGATYQWLDCSNGNTPISGATGQSYTALVPGNYAVIMTQNGCSDTSACMFADAYVGISELSYSKNIRVYPNPNDGNFIMESTEEGSYTVVDQLGRQVYSFDLSANNNYSVKIENLDTGIYFITGTHANKTVHQKILVNR